MSLPCLRPGLPASYAFSVEELPYRAKLDQNEAPVDLPEELKREIAEEVAARPWNRYLQPAEYLEAKERLAGVFGLDAEHIAITVGGDQAIEAAFLVGGGPGRRARWFEPTYPYIGNAARRTSTERDPVTLGPDIDRRLDAASVTAEPAPDLVAIVSPNNPTGGLVSEEALDAALADERRLLLLDEAYADYAGQSALSRVGRSPNLLVARSLSKSALAGVHVGFVAGHPEAIAIIDRLYTSPYHLSALQLVAARRYPDIRPHVERAVADAVSERRRVAEALEAAEGIEVRPSRASFLLFRVAGGRERAAELHARLAEAGVRIRDVSGLAGLEEYLRVTIGTREENDLFLELMRDHA